MSERITITLHELHCEAQSEGGGCEPYLFTSYYAVGDGGEVSVTSPRHSDVRGAFADDVDSGQTLSVPQEIGSCELPSSGRTGIVALVIDEDKGRDVAVAKAHDAFHAEVENQLRQNGGTIDTAEILYKVRHAIRSTFDYSDLHRDQDDILGLAVHEIAGPGAFELPIGDGDDRFVLRGEVR